MKTRVAGAAARTLRWTLVAAAAVVGPAMAWADEPEAGEARAASEGVPETAADAKPSETRVASREKLDWRPPKAVAEEAVDAIVESESDAAQGPRLSASDSDDASPDADVQDAAAADDQTASTEAPVEEPAEEADTARPTPNLAGALPKQDKDPPPPLSRSLRNLRSRMRTVLSFYYRKPLNTVEHTPWEIMHGMLAYELHSRVLDGGPRGRPMTAIGHLCFNRPSRRQRMMRLTADGALDVEVGVGLQGHRGQLLAMLAQCNVSTDYPVRVNGEELDLRDLIVAEQRTCYAKTELTFKLIGLGHYLASDSEWKNDRGERWDIPRLIREERVQPIRGAACGGTHRLAGLSLAYRRREARGEPIDGEYLDAARFVSQYQTQAFRLQNSDGSLSTEWFRGRGAEDTVDRRIRTTGHLMEWLAYSLPDEQLRSPRTIRAVSYLTTLLAHNANHEWHLGSLGHALHALVVYDKRVFQPLDPPGETGVAGPVDPTSNRYRGYAVYRGVMRNSRPEPSGFFGLFGSKNASRPGSGRTR